MINPLEGIIKVGSIFYIEEKKKYWLCTCIEKDEECIVYKGVLNCSCTNKDSYPEFIVTRKINGKEVDIRFRIGRKLYEFNITRYNGSDDNKLASIFSNPAEPLNLYEFEQLVNTIFISIV